MTETQEIPGLAEPSDEADLNGVTHTCSDRNLRIVPIVETIGHHAGHSGYHQLVKHLDGSQNISSVPMVRRIELKHVPDRIALRIARKAGMRYYHHQHLCDESCLAVDWLRGRDCIYHFLYGENAYRYAGHLKTLSGKNRIVCTYHQPPETFEKVVTARDHLRRLDAVVVVADNQLPFFQQLAGPERVFMVPHGVDTDFFCPTESAMTPRTERICLFVGNWLRDFDTLYATIRALQGRKARVRFVLVASPARSVTPTARDNLERFTSLAGVACWDGISDQELLNLYQRASVLLLPLLDCTANNSLLEALACGLPAVVTDVGGIRSYVDEGCSILTPPGDASAMADAVRELLDDEALRLRMGQESRRRARAFAWPNIVSSLLDVYRSVWS